MANATLYHPVSLPLLRNVIQRENIRTKRITQVSCQPMGGSAAYDVRIQSIGNAWLDADLATPRFVKQEIDSNFRQPGGRWGWSGECEYVVWSGRGYWTARVRVKLDVAPEHEKGV